MENTKLKNEIAPWQEKGRWYKITFEGYNPSGTTNYYWKFVESESDPIFNHSNVVGKIQVSDGSSSSTVTVYNRIQSSRINIKHFEKQVCAGNNLAVSITQTTSTPTALELSTGQNTSYYVGATMNSTNFTNGLKIVHYIFMEIK